jgi:hypothetical protein
MCFKGAGKDKLSLYCPWSHTENGFVDPLIFNCRNTRRWRHDSSVSPKAWANHYIDTAVVVTSLCVVKMPHMLDFFVTARDFLDYFSYLKNPEIGELKKSSQMM